jgi:hypothetical protein
VPARFASLASLSLALVLSATPAALAQEVSSVPLHPCRDAHGEPVPCNTVVAAPTPAAPEVVVVPQPAAPAVVVVTPTEEPARAEPAAPTVYDRDGAFMQMGLFVANVDPRRLHLTPEDPARLPAVARGVLVHGEGAPLGLVLGGFQLAFGARPAPFLRFPELRFAIYGGDVEPGSSPAAQRGDVTATVGSLLVVRADLGFGLEAHAGPFGFYATARAGIAGYFADAALTHATLGDFGRATLAEDALELGWELAASVELDEGLSLQLSAEGMHLGAETMGGSFRLVGTF